MLFLSFTAPFVPTLPSFPPRKETIEPPAPLLSHDGLSKNIALFTDEKTPSFLSSFSRRMDFLNKLCIRENGCWIVPSNAYRDSYTRDSFWILAASGETQAITNTIDQMSAFSSPEGQIPTAITKNKQGEIVPFYNDDESTLFFILTNYLLHKEGHAVDKTRLLKAFAYSQKKNVVDGQFTTCGNASDEAEKGAYHYWADTLLCEKKSVISYNQGLFCVALEGLEQMGIPVDARLKAQALKTYQNIHDRENPSIIVQSNTEDDLDISALMPEALSLYFFDKSLLGQEKVIGTVNALYEKAMAHFDDGRFLGFRTLVLPNGNYVEKERFLHAESTNSPGSYHNGGSWMLYDMLALYAAARHNDKRSPAMMTERIHTEQEHLPLFSYEFIRTTEGNMGATSDRAYYGWNTFVAKLLTPHEHGQ